MAAGRTPLLVVACLAHFSEPQPASPTPCAPRGIALLLRTAGRLMRTRADLLKQYAADLQGVASFWVQYDTTCAPSTRINRRGKCVAVRRAALSNLTALERSTANLRLHITNSSAVIKAFPFLSANWYRRERITEWGDNPGRQQHELFLLAWWLGVNGSASYRAVWLLEDDVRFGGSVAGFVLAQEGGATASCDAHGPDYAGSEFKPTFEGSGSTYLREQWRHWTKGAHFTRAFARTIPREQWVRKVEYVERYSARLLGHLLVLINNGSLAFGEFFASSACRAVAWCSMRDLACCPPTKDFAYGRHCDAAGLPWGTDPAEVRNCVQLSRRHWNERISPEAWHGALASSERWVHPVKWR